MATILFVFACISLLSALLSPIAESIDLSVHDDIRSLFQQMCSLPHKKYCDGLGKCHDVPSFIDFYYSESGTVPSFECKMMYKPTREWNSTVICEKLYQFSHNCSVPMHAPNPLKLKYNTATITTTTTTERSSNGNDGDKFVETVNDFVNSVSNGFDKMLSTITKTLNTSITHIHNAASHVELDVKTILLWVFVGVLFGMLLSLLLYACFCFPRPVQN